jgi:hypothetical protein
MRTLSLFVVAAAAVLTVTCAKRLPEPSGLAPGAPHVSWIIMSGDRDNPDREFVCQSAPRTDCVIPVSRPDAQVFSDVHFYYHGAGAETKYSGAIDVGFFQGSPASRQIQANTTVPKTEKIMNHSVIGIVTATPGSYPVRFAVVATVAGSGTNQPIEAEVPVVVK